MEDIKNKAPQQMREPTKDERDAGILAMAMTQILVEIAPEVRPSREAVTSAIVSIQANFLASIEDDRDRKAVRKAMADLLPVLLAHQVAATKAKAAFKI
jgi:hypothetical protein